MRKKVTIMLYIKVKVQTKKIFLLYFRTKVFKFKILEIEMNSEGNL